MAKIRVHELAKDLGMPSKQLVDVLQDLGMDIKNHMSTMEDNQVAWVKKQIKERSSPKEVPPSRDAQIKRDQTRSKEPRDPNSNERMRPRHEPPSNSMVRPDNQRTSSTSGQNNRQRDGRRQTSVQRNRNDGKHSQSSYDDKKPRQNNPNKPVTGVKSAQAEPNRPSNQGRNQQNGQGTTHPESKNRGERVKGKENTGQRTGGAVKNSTANNNNKTGKAKSGSAKNRTKPQPRRDFSRPTKKTKHKRKKQEIVIEVPEVISVGDSISVRDLAEKLTKSPAEIVKNLMDLGTMATINQVLDFDTAEILASLYEVKVEREISEEDKILEEIIDDKASLKPRPPVVTVMGHVDHGKTSLLDRIRKEDVASGEAGGITQHIGAYQVKLNEKNRITFIDTPGHEAFTAMRARGANLTDIVILVVAADDGVMPQTVEAINHIRAAEVPFIVAVNKIDKPAANPDRVLQQLTEYNIVPEDWGGDTIVVPVSAKSGEGVDTLLEMVLLLAEMQDIKANPDRPAEGIVIEGELDKGRGAVATVLVQKGTLRIGDCIICGVNWCKVRAMNDHRGRKVEEATPSMPVEIMGWSDVPEAGGRVQVCDEKVAKEVATLRITERKLEEQKQSSRVSLDDFFKQMQSAEMKELNLIIKGDVQGSVEALSQSLLRLSTDEVQVKVIHAAVGAISETDVMLASASNAIIIGFNVRPDSKARKYGEDEKIDIRLYRVIYEAIEDVKKAMSGLLEPEYHEKYLGRASVRATFKVPNVGTVAGCYVIEGKIQRNAEVRVLRDGVIIYEGKLASLKRFKDDAREVLENYECGMGIKDFNDIKEGDIIEAFIMEEVPREL
ncbi:translation initiation factor IF-2 [Syntrophomonas erecta]